MSRKYSLEDGKRNTVLKSVNTEPCYITIIEYYAWLVYQMEYECEYRQNPDSSF